MLGKVPFGLEELSAVGERTLVGPIGLGAVGKEVLLESWNGKQQRGMVGKVIQLTLQTNYRESV